MPASLAAPSQHQSSLAVLFGPTPIDTGAKVKHTQSGGLLTDPKGVANQRLIPINDAKEYRNEEADSDGEFSDLSYDPSELQDGQPNSTKDTLNHQDISPLKFGKRVPMWKFA